MKRIRWLGSSTFAETDREENDYYATPREAVDKLLEQEKFSKHILEPACGEGHISKVLEEYGKIVESTDFIDRGFWDQKDFFEYTSNNKDIITNPPYNVALDFISHALEISQEGQKIAMLLRIQFLESTKRYPFFKENPPTKVYVFSKRLKCAKNGDFDNIWASTVCYAWFVWEKWYLWPTIVDWLI